MTYIRSNECVKESVMTDNACCGPACCTPEGTGIKEAVQAKYGAAARSVTNSYKASCCSTAEQDPVTSNLYGEAATGGLPAAAGLASLGCGNPTALAERAAGQIVLHPGSGGRVDFPLAPTACLPTVELCGLH